ncbi:hypothetical protein CDAR_56431 [Caerostris darwini]|uniref:Uncharacterized protein n=1 Tax=Caerostris darwini TaxID=1538125 RepID=A0AAV4N635_9ARAC|nr:hypothetical protein CDAR_56431 [Caerostris darwini]
MAVQTSNVCEDVFCHGQHQLDVRGRTPPPQQNNSVCFQAGCSFQALLPDWMGSSPYLRLHLGISDVPGTAHSLLERLREVKLRLDPHWPHGHCPLGEWGVHGEYHSNSDH